MVTTTAVHIPCCQTVILRAKATPTAPPATIPRPPNDHCSLDQPLLIRRRHVNGQAIGHRIVERQATGNEERRREKKGM